MALQRIQRPTAKRGAAQPPRTRAFLLEMLLNMLIFALCAVVALQIFVQGKIATNESEALTVLTLDAETLAETFKVSEGDLSTLTLASLDGETKGKLTAEGTLVFYYNHELRQTNADGAQYTLELAPKEEGDDRVNTIEIVGHSSDKEFFSFEVAQFKPKEGR